MDDVVAPEDLPAVVAWPLVLGQEGGGGGSVCSTTAAAVKSDILPRSRPTSMGIESTSEQGRAVRRGDTDAAGAGGRAEQRGAVAAERRHDGIGAEDLADRRDELTHELL